MNEMADHNQVDADCYNKIVSSATLSAILLKDVNFAGDLSKLSGSPSIDFRIGSGMLAWGYDAESSMLTGIFQYTLQGIHDEKVVLAVKAVYAVEYNVDIPCESDEGHLFLQRVGKYAAYPYYRALFSTMTDQAGIAMPPLPVLSNLSQQINPTKKPPRKGKRDN